MEDILLSYLDRSGILLCNREADLPCLEDIGCAWGDVTALLDRQALFYCKLYRGRTTYLSREAYYLLRAVRGERMALTPAAARVYELLLQAPGAETDFLKPLRPLRQGLPGRPQLPAEAPLRHRRGERDRHQCQLVHLPLRRRGGLGGPGPQRI